MAPAVSFYFENIYFYAAYPCLFILNCFTTSAYSVPVLSISDLDMPAKYTTVFKFFFERNQVSILDTLAKKLTAKVSLKPF